MPTMIALAHSPQTEKPRRVVAAPTTTGSFSIDDGNCNDNATNQKFDWSSEEK